MSPLLPHHHPAERPSLPILFAALLLLTTLTGCSAFNGTRAENLLGRETNLIKFSYRAAEELIKTAYPPLMPQNPQMPILTTTFVDNNDLQQTSQFGRILQEHMSSRFVQLGYTVREVKLAKSMEIKEFSGETILSRDLKKLTGSQKAQAILVGTISYANRTMYISTRLINPNDSSVVASSDYRMIMDDHILAMFGLQRGDDADGIAEPDQPWMNKFF